MRWKTRTLAIAGAAVAVAAGAVGAALATTGSSSPKEAATAFIHDVATRLGVSDAKLTTALKDASAARIDQALKDGKITQAQADELKARIQSGDAPLLGPPGFGHRGGFGDRGPRVDVLAAAASYIGKTEAELRTALEGGKTLAQVAKDEGKTVEGLKDALAAAAKTDLDAKVKAGDLTEAQAKAILDRLTSNLDDVVNGTGPRGPGMGGHRGGDMGEGHGAPGAFFAPTAAQPA